MSAGHSGDDLLDLPEAEGQQRQWIVESPMGMAIGAQTVSKRLPQGDVFVFDYVMQNVDCQKLPGTVISTLDAEIWSLLCDCLAGNQGQVDAGYAAERVPTP